MSRIGNNPISIPEGISIEVNKDIITVKGKNGEMNQAFDGVSFDISNDFIVVKRNSESKDHKSKHGLFRSLVSNMVKGVSEGFTLELELVGVGYRATSSGQKLDLALGYSHTIVMNIAPEVKVECVNEKGSNPIIKLSSLDKQLLGHVAAKIRSFRRPEPYKGKGIKFVGEQIRRKAGKSA
tara:strand:+ start:1539 stop:2081 length:543 start_codon:yes stop_codon:yes gene_type:complete